MSEHLLSNSAAVPLAEQAGEEARNAVMALKPRRLELLASLQSVDVKDDEEMRRAIDKIVLSKALRDAADAALQPIGTPYHDASQAVRNVADDFQVALKQAERTAQQSIDAFRSRQREAAAQRANEQRRREHELRVQAGLVKEPEKAAEIATVKPADVRLGSTRSDYRGQVFDRKVVKVTITDPRLLPDDVLTSPNVTKALEAAVRIKAKLTRDIPGATIEDDQKSTVKGG